MDYDKRTLWIGVVVCLSFPCDVENSGYIKVASECFNALGRKLQLNCAYSNDPSFISIDWNVTFLGRSTCEGETTCCPDDTVCTILVLDSEHFGGHHWLNLTACNGQTLCSVSVVRTDHGCSLTDYEYVTYRCITPEISTSRPSTTVTQTLVSDVTIGTHLSTEESTDGGLTSTGFWTIQSTSIYDGVSYTASDRPTSKPSAVTTSSSVSYTTSHRPTNTGPTTETTSSSSHEGSTELSHDTGYSSSTMNSQAEYDGPNNFVIIWAVVAAMVLLLIILAVVIYIYRRRRNGSPEKTEEYGDNIKGAPCQDKGEVDGIGTISGPPNKKKPAPSPPSRHIEHCNAKPIIQTSNGRPPVPAKSPAVHAEPASMECKPHEQAEKHVDSLEGDETDPDYSYTYAHFKQPQNTPYYNPSFTGQTETKDTQIIYADMLHMQNGEYMNNDDDDDEMVLTDNDLYNVRGDDSHGTGDASKRHFQAEDDDDMVLTDNDLYNVRTENGDNEDSSTVKKPELQIEDDDEDMVLTDNDLYHVTVPSRDTESRSVPKQAEHQPEDGDDMMLMDNDLYNVRIEPERPIDDPDDMVLMDNELYS